MFSNDRRNLIACWALLAVTTAFGSNLIARARAATNDAGPTQSSSRVGIGGTYYLRWNGPALVARPQEQRAALMVWIAGSRQAGGATIYELGYLGTQPGEYDLTACLERADGGTDLLLPPERVTITSLLPADHDGAVESYATPPLPRQTHYRVALGLVAAAWLSIGLTVAVRSLARRMKSLPRVSPAMADAEDDPFAPLLCAARSGTLTSEDQARLERLLIAQWREQLELDDCDPERALRQLRAHAEAGPWLRELESWLHARPGPRRCDPSEVVERLAATALRHPPTESATIVLQERVS